MKSVIWNPWHGCIKYSEGCKNCYVYRRDSSIGKDASEVKKTASFDLPISKTRSGEYRITSGTLVYACMTSDFFIDVADKWRKEAWSMIRERSDLDFYIITKRIERFAKCIPQDWNGGYDNVIIACTVENQRQADIRMPVFIDAPIKHKQIVCEPLLSRINVEKYLSSDIERLIAGGESGSGARICEFEWVMALRSQCENRGVSFYFKQTGARFKKDGRIYSVSRKFQLSQARRADIDIY